MSPLTIAREIGWKHILAVCVAVLFLFILATHSRQSTEPSLVTNLPATTTPSTVSSSTVATTTPVEESVDEVTEISEVVVAEAPPVVPEPEPEPVVSIPVVPITPATEPEIESELVVEPEPAVEEETEVVTDTSFSSSAFLAGHNAARSAVGIAPLSWSTSLAASAQSWADVLQGEGCTMRHDFNSPFGENLYWQWVDPARGSGLISSPTDANRSWIDGEIDDYDYDSNACAPGAVCGHYTQVVWAETTAVGCGVASCKDGDRQSDIWVCRYNPPGNDGTRPY